MLDDNWELINGPPAHHIEQLNAANTINVLEALVTYLVAHKTPKHDLPLMPNENALRELHRCGTLFLLNKPGQYRDGPVHLADPKGNIVYQPPPHTEVPDLMQALFAELGQIWISGDALDVAAYTLWRTNWIHPFKNGNGRTARTFSYACLCARLGVMLPGTTTIIDQIMTTRSDYEAALRAADTAAKADPNARDLERMRGYLNRLLQIQVASI